MDSGATNHVTGDKAVFQSLQIMQNKSQMKLPTGDSVHISHYGEVKLNDGIILKNALYVPSFKQNLLSVHSLISGGEYTVEFFPNHWLIKRKIDGKTVGVGKAHKGLYYLLHGSLNRLVKSCTQEYGSVNAVENNEKLDIPSVIQSWKGLNEQTLFVAS